jgi:hypothetical protein
MVAPYRPERPVIPDRPNPAEENISYAYETGQSESPVVTFMIWLLLLGVSLGLVLYFLWPTARTQAEKDTDLVVKTPVRESTIIDVIEESVITESIPSESPRDDMQETIEGDDMIEDVAIEEVAIEEASIKEWPAPLFKEVIEPTQPPYASIERQGNVVTITLREAETQQDVSEISTLDYASVNDAGSDVDGQAVATTEMAGQEGELAEPESLSEMRGMETPEPDTQEDASRPGPEPRVVADTASRLDMPPLPPMTAREITHIVVKGDTLWDIALRYIHDPFRYPELARLSNIKNPDLIYPGDRVRILIIRH